MKVTDHQHRLPYPRYSIPPPCRLFRCSSPVVARKCDVHQRGVRTGTRVRFLARSPALRAELISSAISTGLGLLLSLDLFVWIAAVAVAAAVAFAFALAAVAVVVEWWL